MEHSNLEQIERARLALDVLSAAAKASEHGNWFSDSLLKAAEHALLQALK